MNNSTLAEMNLDRAACIRARRGGSASGKWDCLLIYRDLLVGKALVAPRTFLAWNFQPWEAENFIIPTFRRDELCDEEYF